MKLLRRWSVALDLWIYGAVVLVVSLIAGYVSRTSHGRIDTLLVALDREMFGFDVRGAMAWALGSGLWGAFKLFYLLLSGELVAVPVGLLLLQRRASFYRLCLALIVSFILGAAVYYRWPSSGPASVFGPVGFSPDQVYTGQKFTLKHRGLQVDEMRGGMIAFPSFHVVWGTLLSLSLLGSEWFLLGLALNILVAFSAVVLGWHFLVDVLAGCSLGVASWVLSCTVLGPWLLMRVPEGRKNGQQENGAPGGALGVGVRGGRFRDGSDDPNWSRLDGELHRPQDGAVCHHGPAGDPVRDLARFEDGVERHSGEVDPKGGRA